MNHGLFEIGLEELPARFIDDAEQQLYDLTKEWLKEHRISYEKINTFATPRRLAVLIESLSEWQTTLTEELRGPSEKIGKDEEGNWTRAAIGFAKGQGKTVEDLFVKDVDGTPYLFLKKQMEGKRTIDILPSFKEVISSITFPQQMRWGEQKITYARPIRWLVALFNDQVIPFEIAKVKTSNQTYGHRFLGEPFTIDEPKHYEKLLYNQYVIVNKYDREEKIKEGIHALERRNQFVVDLDPYLLREVCHLLEYPTVFLGTFDESFLNLPEEVLVTSMKEHQRYFPVRSQNGKLIPYFIGVRNGDTKALDQVIQGNEKVLHARLADARFFYEEDQKQSIEYYNQQLKRVVFHEKLGTIEDKLHRMKQLVSYLNNQLDIDQELKTLSERAVDICKFDLSTLMVNEFPELQGVIGEKYAENLGEDKKVARAIREHYLPVHAEDQLPQTNIGAILSLADKIDTIIGCISIGLTPSGSRDPYGLRRQALGILQILINEKWHLSLEDLIQTSLEKYGKEDKTIKEKILDFFKLRIVYLFQQYTIEKDVIDAVLTSQISSIPFILQKAKLLSDRRKAQEYRTIQEELHRVLNMATNIEKPQDEVNENLLQTESESRLYDEIKQTQDHVQAYYQKFQAEEALELIEALAEPIHNFFEHNMVMDQNEAIKFNRMTLVYEMAEIILSFADLQKIQWRQHQ